jgi:hypothetical protein
MVLQNEWFPGTDRVTPPQLPRLSDLEAMTQEVRRFLHLFHFSHPFTVHSQ